MDQVFLHLLVMKILNRTNIDKVEFIYKKQTHVHVQS